MRIAVLLLVLGACSGGSSSSESGALAIRITVPTTDATYVTNSDRVEVAGEYSYFPLGLPGSVRNLTTKSEYLLQLRDGMWSSKSAVLLAPGTNNIYVWLGGASASITIVRNP